MRSLATGGDAVILAVALSPSLDRTLVVDEITVGQIHRPDVVVEVAGGKGFNVARALHLMNVPVIAAGVLGGPTGDVVRALLDQAGVTSDLVCGTATTRTCTSVACRTGRHLTEFYEPAPAMSPRDWEGIQQVVTRSIGPGDWVTISGSAAATDTAGHAVQSLIRCARERGAHVAVDTHGETLRHAVAAEPDLVKVNHLEAAGLVADSQDTLQPARLAELTARLVGPRCRSVVTAGTRGAWAYDGSSHHVSSPVVGHYPVGSGDCFLAGLVAGLHEGLPLALALVRGAAVATANALEPGAAQFDPGSLNRIEAGIALTST